MREPVWENLMAGRPEVWGKNAGVCKTYLCHRCKLTPVLLRNLFSVQWNLPRTAFLAWTRMILKHSWSNREGSSHIKMVALRAGSIAVRW